MATIQYVERGGAAESVGQVYDQMAAMMGGKVPSIARALAHNPGLFSAFMAVNEASRHMQLDARLSDLAYLVVSHINGCDYCAFYHRLTGKRAGLNEREIADVADYDTSDVYSAHERDVMLYAAQVTRQIAPEPELVARLKETLADRELMELTFIVGLANLTNRFNVALGNELP